MRTLGVLALLCLGACEDEAVVCTLDAPSVHNPLDPQIWTAQVHLRHPEQYGIKLTSDRGGVLTSARPDPSGTLHWLASGLEPGPQNILMEVSPIGEATICSTTVPLTVAPAPSLNVTSPEPGARLPAHDPVALTAHFAAPASDVQWYSQLDGPLGNAPLDAAGDAYMEALLTPGRHRLTATTVGPEGTVQHTRTIEVVAPPKAPLVAIIGDAVHGKPLTARAGMGDGSTPPEMQWTWYLNGTAQEDLRAPIVPATLVEHGQTWTVRAYAHDGLQLGPPGEATVWVDRPVPSP